MNLIEMPPDSPFNLNNSDAYRRWRDWKLAAHPHSLEETLVEIADPRNLAGSEYDKLFSVIARCNFVLYASKSGDDPDKAIPRQLGRRFGLESLDSNYLADDDGITSLTVRNDGVRAAYIPYSNRPISWHTDGYYNTPERQIRGLLLHCVSSASDGGENALLDHEIAYIRLRDSDPELIRALMVDDVMTIPPGTDGDGSERAAATGPVFSWHAPSDSLHMRYTARKRNIEWRQDGATAEATAALTALLAGDEPLIVRGRLEAGMGLICNNILHDRSGFADAAGSKRLLYRARYHDRIGGTGLQALFGSRQDS
jgi:alpha-ketoglutarate-dependent taurine dioxygenase